MILSYYDIGEIFYDSCNKTALAKLQKLQNTALRCIFKCNYDTSIIELHSRANLVTARDRRCLNLCTTAHKREIPHFEIDKPYRLNLRSNTKTYLRTSLSRNKLYERCFINKATIFWNSLSENLKIITSDECKLFKTRLKSYEKQQNKLP